MMPGKIADIRVQPCDGLISKTLRNVILEGLMEMFNLQSISAGSSETLKRFQLKNLSESSF